MCKRILSLALIILLLNLTFYSTAKANTDSEKENKFAVKVKSEIAKLGTGKEARIEVKFKDKRKLKGYVSQINENSFVVVQEDAARTSTEVPYSNAKQIKGSNLSTGVKIAIVAGAILLLIAIAASGVV